VSILEREKKRGERIVKNRGITRAPPNEDMLPEESKTYMMEISSHPGSFQYKRNTRGINSSL